MGNNPSRIGWPLCLALCGVSLAFGAPATRPYVPVVATVEHADGQYRVGEEVRWNVHVDTEVTGPLHYAVKRGQRAEVASGTLAVNQGLATVDATLDAPGTLLLEVTGSMPDGRPIRALGGALVGAGGIQPSAPRPADFDDFWAAKIEELAKVPMNPRFDEPATRPSTQPATQPAAPPSNRPADASIEYHKLTLDNIRGTKIYAQLARPTAGEKFPALVIVQWAGVYALDPSWVTGRAKDGWLVINVMPHKLPIDSPADFYKQQFSGPLKDYWAIGNDDRETSYFLRMYLSCYRAADYLASRPDWDGKTMVVMGGSQGGMQSLMTAAIYPKITAALANVPAGCDYLGDEAGRKAGWPQWLDFHAGKDTAKVREAARYFDVVNFAPHIKCPTLVGFGLIDETCPAAGVVAAFNLINAPKEVVVLPAANHAGTGNTHAAYNDRCEKVWLPALRRGETPPVGK